MCATKCFIYEIVKIEHLVDKKKAKQCCSLEDLSLRSNKVHPALIAYMRSILSFQGRIIIYCSPTGNTRYLNTNSFGISFYMCIKPIKIVKANKIHEINKINTFQLLYCIKQCKILYRKIWLFIFIC